MAAIRVGTRYHTQDSAELCGAAVTQMLLEHLGVCGRSQRDLHCIGRAKSQLPGYFIDPAGLAGLLNEELAAAGHSAGYQALVLPSGEEAVALVASCLQSDSTRPAFTLDRLHWVLVDGIEVDAAGWEVTTLWVHQPVLDIRGAFVADPTPPHHAADPCGTKGHGLYEAAFTARLWSSVLEVQPELGGVPVVVVPPPAGTAPLRLGDEPEATAPLPDQLGAHLGGVPLRLGDGLQVRGRAAASEGYQLLPLMAGELHAGWVTVAAGRRRSVGLFAAPTPLKLVDREAAAALARDALESSQDLQVSGLEWDYAEQARSPFAPFREARHDDGRRVFVSIDGQVFPALTRTVSKG